MRIRPAAVALSILVAASARAQVTQAAALKPHQQLARDIYKELIEINTADSVGNTTAAADAMAKRFLAAGFPQSDVQVLAPRPDKGNLVVRCRGTGPRKPLLLLAHLDVVQALKSDWSPDLDPFKFLERYRSAGSLYAKHSTKELMGEAYFVAVNYVIVATANRMLRD